MSDGFPIPAPDRLPVRINPCPIVEAIFEVRFTSKVAWATLPGMLYAQIRDKYPQQTQLPLAQLPVYRLEFLGHTGSHQASGRITNLGLCPRPRDFRGMTCNGS